MLTSMLRRAGRRSAGVRLTILFQEEEEEEDEEEERPSRYKTHPAVSWRCSSSRKEFADEGNKEEETDVGRKRER